MNVTKRPMLINKGASHIKISIKEYSTYKKSYNNKEKEWKFWYETNSEGIEKMISRLSRSDLDTKRHWLDKMLEACENRWEIAANLLQRIVWENGIKDLKRLGLYDWTNASKDIKDTRYNLGCFKRLPDARGFEIKLSQYDWLLARFGLKIRFKPTLKWQRYNNKGINRYLEHQIRRLDKCILIRNDRLYWRIVTFLVKRSRIFFLTQLRKTFPRWHREEKLWKIIKIYKKYLEKARLESTNLRVKRVFISKDEKKKRPLGVPGEEWRLYLGLLNQFAQHYLINKVSVDQHAYLHGRGTLTAWRRIVENVINCKNIYEFDLKGFFDSVDLIKLKPALERRGIPRNICDMVFALNTEIPRGLVNVMEYKGPDLSDEDMEVLIRSEPIKMDSRWVWSFVDKNSGKYVNIKTRGMAQGSPLSPLLSLVALEETLFKMFPNNVIMYADDGIIYGGDEITENSIRNKLEGMDFGVSINWDKSGWVKQAGQWMKPLKFLGLVTDGEKLRASTRKGSVLVYDKSKLIDVYNSRQKEADLRRETGDLESEMKFSPWSNNEPVKTPSMLQLVNSKLWGLMQNRLFTGSYETSDVVQNFQLTYSVGSWMHQRKYLRKKLTVFNSTSYALRSLYFKLKLIKYNHKQHARLDAPYVNLSDLPISSEISMYDPDSNVDISRLKNKHISVYEQAMKSSVEKARKEWEKEEAKWVNKNRRERVWTEEEIKRRIVKPLDSVWYGGAYYNFLKWYRSIVDLHYIYRKGKDAENWNVEVSRWIPPIWGNDIGTDFFNRGSVYSRFVREYASYLGISKSSKAKRLNWKGLFKQLKDESMWVILNWSWRNHEADFHGWGRILHLIGFICAWLIFKVPAELDQLSDLFNDLGSEKNTELTGKEPEEVVTDYRWFFLGLCVIFIISASLHSSIAFEASQNAILESLVRDQASIIEGQRITIELLRSGEMS